MNLQDCLKNAQKEAFAIGQFNFSTLSQLRGIIEAAKQMKSPVILGTSEGESKFLGLKQIVNLRDFFRRETGLPIFLNLDHGKSFGYLKIACDLGYDAVHFDGSKMPLEENIEVTKKVLKYAEKSGALVEGEVGIIGNEASKIYKENFKIRPGDLTKPEEAERYINETGVNSLAVSIGNLHGMGINKENPKLYLEKLSEIKKRAKDTFLVLHGGSGINEKDIKEAIKIGIVKVNINTELRLAFTKTLREALNKNLEEITPYKYLPNVIMAVQKVVKEKIELFGSDNKI